MSESSEFTEGLEGRKTFSVCFLQNWVRTNKSRRITFRVIREIVKHI